MSCLVTVGSTHLSRSQQSISEKKDTAARVSLSRHVLHRQEMAAFSRAINPCLRACVRMQAAAADKWIWNQFRRVVMTADPTSTDGTREKWLDSAGGDVISSSSSCRLFKAPTPTYSSTCFRKVSVLRVITRCITDDANHDVHFP